MSLPGTCRSAPQAASSRSVSGDARTESGAGKGPRPRVDFLHNLLLMINNGDLFFDDGSLALEDPQRLETEALQRYFKHARKLSTFERQLYRFGFRKLTRKGKLERQVFYNIALKGESAEAILTLRPRPSASRRAETASRTPAPTSEQPLSENPDSRPADTPSSNAIPLTSLNENTDSHNLSSAHKPRLDTSTGGGGQRKGASRRSPRKKRRAGSKTVGSGSKGQGDSGGSEDGDLGVGKNDPRKPGPIESRGGHEVNVRRRSGRTFCGWQRPLRQTDGSDESGSTGGVGVLGQGKAGKGPTPVFTKRDESNHTRDDEGDWVSAPTMRKFDGRNDSVSGGGSSSVPTTTPLTRKQDIDPGRSHATEDFGGHAESGSSVIDLASTTMPPQGCPAMVAMTGSQVPTNHLGAPSVKLSFAGKGSFPLSYVAQQSDMDVDVAFRRPLHNRDVEFAGKNFGDSILGEYGVAEDPGATVGGHDWSVNEDCANYGGGGGGGGADGVTARGGRKDPGIAGLSSASSDGYASTATLCGKDVPKASGRGFGGVLSPNQLPSTPSPLSLDRPAYHSMQCLMGL